MDEETKVYTSIEELETEELARLYSALGETQPGTDEYNQILNQITKIRTSLNEGNKIWVQKEENENKNALEEKKLKNDKVWKVLGAIGNGISLVSTVGMAWVTMKYNIRFGPISTRDAWTQIFKKKF